jgi:hypothetical protein
MRKEDQQRFARTIALIRLPTYREFISIKKVARVLLAPWSPERDKAKPS